MSLLGWLCPGTTTMKDKDAERINHRLMHVEDALEGIRESLAYLTQIGERLMALADDLKASIAKLDAETTAVGTLITALAAKIKNGMTDQEVADLKTAFGALDERLKGLAVDPTNPVPPPPPQLAQAKQLAGRP